MFSELRMMEIRYDGDCFPMNNPVIGWLGIKSLVVDYERNQIEFLRSLYLNNLQTVFRLSLDLFSDR